MKFNNGDRLMQKFDPPETDGQIYIVIGYVEDDMGLDADLMTFREDETHIGGIVRYVNSTELWYIDGRHVLTEIKREKYV